MHVVLGVSVANPVELVVGSARSGKAGYVLEAYALAMAEAGPGRCLMLVPTALRRRATESRLLDRAPGGVLVRPQVLTLPDLADRLLTAAHAPVRRITELARRQIIRDCLARLDERAAAVLGPARHAPGMVDALDALFRELKAARVDPDTFGRALADPLGSNRNRALARLYGDYQAALQARDVYDDKGQFWHAAALVADGFLGPFADLALLAVDGFQDFEPAQLDVIEGLAAQAARTIVTLTWTDDRPSLFGVTGRTRDELHRRFGDRIEERVLDEPSALPVDLEHVRRSLFLIPSPEPRPAPGQAIRIVRAAGATREVEEAARQIAARLAEGDVAPGGIAVLARSLGAYGPLIEEIFPRYGIDVEVARRTRLADLPIVRAAMAMPRLQTERYSFRALARVMKSNYFTPEVFGADAETARTAVRLAREANVWEGRQRYALRFEYLRNQTARAADRTDEEGEPLYEAEEARRRLEQIDRARELIERLFAALEMPERATRAAMAARLQEMVGSARLWDAPAADPDPERRARDVKALGALEGVLAEVARLDPDGAAEVTLQEFLDEVQHGLGLESVAPSRQHEARVVAMDVHAARAVAFDEVYLLGLAERQFPRRGREHPFFDDAERELLRGRGVALRDAGGEASDEMLLFYMAATRAGRRLVLSRPTLDTQGRPVLASHYLDTLLDLFEASGEAFPAVEVTTRDLDLPDERARSERELLARSIFGAWGPGATPDMDERLGVLSELVHRRPTAEDALAGLAIEWEREHGPAFGPFDGRLVAEDLQAALAERVPAHMILSAMRLERFGGCPWAFLAHDLLHLEPLEEPSRDLGPLDVGLICHAALERFFAALVRSPLAGRLDPDTLAEALKILHRTAGAYFERLEADGRVGSPALWKVIRKNLLADLERLIAWQAGDRRLRGWQTRYLEVPFGGARPGELEGVGSREPIPLDTRHGTVRLSGRIDRVDVADDGSAVQVIDYKSGRSAPSYGHMQRGTSFQLPVYLWAARAVVPEAEVEAGARAFFLPVRDPKLSGLLEAGHRRGDLDEALALARAYVENFVGAMRAGAFPVWPRDESACTFCDFGEICRYAEWRLQRKWDESPIPGLEVIDAEEDGDEEEDA